MLSSLDFKIPKLNLNSLKNYNISSPNSKDSNYTSYTHEKSITNYFKSKRPNINQIINDNYFNIKINQINTLKQDKTLSTTNHKTFYYNSSSKKNKAKKNKVKNILLTSLFNLPNINNSPINKRSKKNQNFKNYFENNSKSQENSFLNKNETKLSNLEENEGIKLEDYMKDKFYEDIDKKMNIKLKSKIFLHDTSVKDRIIKMNKIGLFWGGVFEYCNPLLSAKKFKYAKKKYHINGKLNDIYADEYKSKSKMNKEIKPILYTNNIFNNLMRKEKLKKELLFYKQRNLDKYK